MGMVPKRRGSLSSVYSGLNNGQILVHVEDKGKKSLYEEILKKIFGEESRNYAVQDTNVGKLGVTSRALKEKNKGYSNIIYLLDKDYDDIFPNDLIFYEETLALLKDESIDFVNEVRIQTFNTMSCLNGVKFLKKYSIENYLLDSLEGIIHGIFIQKGVSKEDIRKDSSFTLAFNDTIDALITTTPYKILNKKKRLMLSLNVDGIIDINTFNIKNDILNLQLRNFKTECTSCDEDFNSLLEETKNNLSIFDIPGKDILTIFLKWLKYQSNYRLEIGQEQATRLLASSLTPSQCESLKEFFTL